MRLSIAMATLWSARGAAWAHPMRPVTLGAESAHSGIALHVRRLAPAHHRPSGTNSGLSRADAAVTMGTTTNSRSVSQPSWPVRNFTTGIAALADRRADRHEDRRQPPLRVGRDAEHVARLSARPGRRPSAVSPSGVPTPRSYIMPRANPANAPRSEPAPAPAPAAKRQHDLDGDAVDAVGRADRALNRQHHQGNGDQSGEEGKRQRAHDSNRGLVGNEQHDADEVELSQAGVRLDLDDRASGCPVACRRR